MIYALYGSDTYRSHKKLNQIIDAYRTKAGAHIDLHYIDTKVDDLAILKGIMGTASLFTPKKLVVVENAFNEEMTSMAANAKQWKDASNQHLLLTHEALDASAKKYFKAWEPIVSQSQEFNELTGAKREDWIRREASDRGVSLTSTHVRNIAHNTTDSWAAVQQIEKIAVGGEVPSLASHSTPTIFDLGDTFFTDKKRALMLLYRFLENGEDEFGIFAYLANHSRKILAIKQCEKDGRPIPSWLGIHPFVAKKTAALARGLTLAQCAAFVNRFFEEDARIKVGLSHPHDSLLHILTE